MSFSDTALELFRARSIDPTIAGKCGVTEEGDEILYPGGRRRRLRGDGPKMNQPHGAPLASWWLPGVNSGAALVCEGETDALAARSYLQKIRVVSVPGASYPGDRLAEECRERGVGVAILIPDADEAGRRFTQRVGAALSEAGLKTVAVPLPMGSDLAMELAKAEDPSERLHELLRSAEVIRLPKPKPKTKPRLDERPDDLRDIPTQTWVQALTGEEVPHGGFIPCPLPGHEGERTASFKVYEGDKGVWCFGCQRGGDIYAFAQELWGCDFKEARHRLAEQFQTIAPQAAEQSALTDAKQRLQEART